MREQAARAEAERVAEMVSGMQLLVDAALAHRTLDDILFDLVARVRAVLDADAAAIYIAAEGALQRVAASGGRRRGTSEPIPFGKGFAGEGGVPSASPRSSRTPTRATSPTRRSRRSGSTP